MAYENDYYGADGKTKRAAGAVEWHFCAVCLLKLRFWDVVLWRGNRKFRKFIFSKMEPLKVANSNYANLGDFNLAGGNKGYLLCLANQESTTNNMGGPYKKNVTNMLDGEWKSSVPSRADFTTEVHGGATYGGVLQADAANKGKTQVRLAVSTDEMKSNAVKANIT